MSSKNLRRKVAVIGAGPAGLTTAYELSKMGIEVDVFEADKTVGGMAKSIELWGQLVDLGPHRFFSSDPRVNRLWLELIDADYVMVQRLTRILYRGKFFDYPLKASNTFRNLGALESAMCLVSYFQALVKPAKRDDTFEDWVSSRFGTRLYETFFKSYSEKLWGISCRELDADFAAQRIKKFSLWEAAKNAVGIKADHKTLVDEFAYPLGGAGIVYERMAESMLQLGGTLRLGTKVISINETDGRPEIVLDNAERKSYDHVVSTMPVTTLARYLKAPGDVLACAAALRFRNTILVFMLVRTEEALFPDQWIYVHSPKLKTGRITNFANWLPGRRQNSQSVLCMEFWCYDEDPIWSEDDGLLVKSAESELVQTQLVKTENIISGKVVRLPKCYPVYSSGYKQKLLPVIQYLSTVPWVTPIGRYGSFKYNNQDHSILMGILAAQNIAGDASHDLWEINTDYEYQEKSRITATGLILEDAAATAV